MNDIIKQLKKARENKLTFKTRVDGDIIATWQISKRREGNLSEMSLYEIEGDKYIVLHFSNKYPNPEDIIEGSTEKSFKCIRVNDNEFDVIVNGIITYRLNNLEDNYINTYSYICGWCLANDFNIHTILDV